jgi:dTDP-4-amino-4,6-dideoxygalactose transaminase
MPTNAHGRLALFGGSPVRPADKPWTAWPIFDDTERRALLDTLESGKWFYGDRVKTFEAAFAAFQQARHCISVTSGTTAAEIAVQALGLEPGDQVIVPAYTFIATATAVARMGAVPIFVDVDDSWCMDPEAVEKAMTPRTRVIMPVHFGGRICDMDKLNALAESRGLTVIEDACHSWGGAWRGRGTGTLGKAGFFSFQASKNISGGEGGAIVTDDDAFADLCRSLTHCGRMAGKAWYEHYTMGTNARITEFSAALLSAQLGRAAEQAEHRIAAGAFLNRELADIEGIFPQTDDDRITRRAYHLYCFRLDPEQFGCSRTHFLKAAEAEGLSFSPGYPMPLYRQPVFLESHLGPNYAVAHCPVSDDLCHRSAVWLHHRYMLGPEEDWADVVSIIRKIKENAGKLAEETL